MRCLNIVFEGLAQFVSSHFRHHDVRDNQFRFVFRYDGHSFLSVAAVLHRIFFRQCLRQIVAQLIVIFYDQNSLMIGILFFMNILVDAGRHVGGTCYLLPALAWCCEMCFMETFAVFRERYLNHRSLIFHTRQINLAFMQPDKFPYQHQSDTTSRHFGVDGIAATEMKFEQLLLFAGRNTNSRILHFYTPRIIAFGNENLYVTVFRCVF